MEQEKVNDRNLILFEKKDNIGIVTLNRPETLNTFNDEMFLEYENVLNKADKDDEVKVIILKGSGKAFCTGIDLKLLEKKDSVDCYLWMKKLQNLTSLIRQIPKPVITMIQDLALAFGIGLVAASDIAIASSKARFGAVAINVGLFCMGPAVFLIQNIGMKKTFELLFTGKIISAKEAMKIGLINRVVPPENLEKETLSVASELASKNTSALRLGKKFFYKMLEDQTEKNSELAGLYFSLLISKFKS